MYGPWGTIHVATCGYHAASEGCDATSQQISNLVTKTLYGSTHGLVANLVYSHEINYVCIAIDSMVLKITEFESIPATKCLSTEA